LKKDFGVSFKGQLATITCNNKIFLTASQVNDDLFKLDGVTVCNESTCPAVSSTAGHGTLVVWHERLCQTNCHIVSTFPTSTNITGMHVVPGSPNLNDSSHGCELGKIHKLPFSIRSTFYKDVGECIASDSVGPFQIGSVGEARYYILFKDLFSGYKVIYFIKPKSEAGDYFPLLTTKIFTVTGHRIRKFRCVCAGAFVSTAHPVLKSTTRLYKASSSTELIRRDSMSASPYRELLGSISYATCTVRPDLVFIVNQQTQFCQNPGPEHWNAGIRVLKYLARTRSHGLCFDGYTPDWSVLDGYADVDLGGDPETRHSTSGYVFRLSGAAISWSSRRQFGL
jgi:hypothetical protein